MHGATIKMTTGVFLERKKNYNPAKYMQIRKETRENFPEDRISRYLVEVRYMNISYFPHPK